MQKATYGQAGLRLAGTRDRRNISFWRTMDRQAGRGRKRLLTLAHAAGANTLFESV